MGAVITGNADSGLPSDGGLPSEGGPLEGRPATEGGDTADVRQVSPARLRPRWVLVLHWGLMSPGLLGLLLTGGYLVFGTAGSSAPNAGLVVLHSVSAAVLIVGMVLWFYGSLVHRGKEASRELLPTFENFSAGFHGFFAYWRRWRELPAYSVSDPTQVVLYWKLPVLVVLALITGYALWSPAGMWADGFSAIMGGPYGPLVLHVIFGLLFLPWLVFHIYLGVMRHFFGDRSLLSIFRSDY